MSYGSVDPQICDWIEQHSLKLFREFAGHQCRSAYVSSKAGECFQFWLDEPANGQIGIYAAGVDGRWVSEPARDWCVPVSDLSAALEEAWATVIGWMMPSERYLPPRDMP